MLPISSKNNEVTDFLSALFTSTSATCVTGLVVFDTFTHWSVFGQIVILCLIQIGGLGFFTIGVRLTMFLRRKISLSQRGMLQESINTLKLSGILKLVKKIVWGTFLIEGSGAILLSIRYIPEFGVTRGIYYSIFHSVSAFCNGGFDLMGNFSSLTAFAEDWVVNICVMSLITLGGLGFAVEGEILHKHNWRKFNLQTKVVILGYLILSLGGGLIIWLFEAGNMDTIGGLSESSQFMASLFQSVTCRTAGFNTVDVSLMREDTLFLMMILMFIGGAPASTAGGLKITTTAVLIMSTVAFLRGRKDVVIFHKRISEDVIFKSMGVFVLCVLWIGIAFAGLLVFNDTHKHFHLILCELFSAFGTVGLGVGITSEWNTICKMILIITMFIGRIGILTFTMSIVSKKPDKLRYPSEDMIIG